MEISWLKIIDLLLFAKFLELLAINYSSSERRMIFIYYNRNTNHSSYLFMRFILKRKNCFAFFILCEIFLLQ